MRLLRMYLTKRFRKFWHPDKGFCRDIKSSGLPEDFFIPGEQQFYFASQWLVNIQGVYCCNDNYNYYGSQAGEKIRPFKFCVKIRDNEIQDDVLMKEVQCIGYPAGKQCKPVNEKARLFVYEEQE